MLKIYYIINQIIENNKPYWDVRDKEEQDWDVRDKEEQEKILKMLWIDFFKDLSVYIYSRK